MSWGYAITVIFVDHFRFDGVSVDGSRVGYVLDWAACGLCSPLDYERSLAGREAA
jgi:hypothetical protein